MHNSAKSITFVLLLQIMWVCVWRKEINIMEQAKEAVTKFPSFFIAGDLWQCREDFYLIQHPVFVPGAVFAPKEHTCFFIVTHGWVKVMMEDIEVIINRGMSVNIMPKQSVKILEQSPDMDAVVYILSKSVSEMIFIKKGFATYSEMRRTPIVSHDEYALRTILDIVNLLRDALEHPYSDNMLDVCASLLNLYFRLAAPDRLWRPLQEAVTKVNRYEQIMTRFTGLLEKYYQKEREVQFYANQLCVTPKYLSVCTKNATGHTANWWINSYVLRDATQMLVYGNLSVKTIAARLGFADQMLFGKYFRRQVGLSPTAYKKQESARLKSSANRSVIASQVK